MRKIFVACLLVSAHGMRARFWPNLFPSNDRNLRVCLINSSLVSNLSETFNYSSSCESCEETCPFAREVRLPRKSNQRIGQLQANLQKREYLNTPLQVTCFWNLSDPNPATEAVSESLLSGFRIYCAREDVARYLMLTINPKNESQQCLAQTQRFNQEMRCVLSGIGSTNIFHEANLRPELFAKYRRGRCHLTLSGLTYAQAVHENIGVTAESVFAASTQMSTAEKLAAAAVTIIKRRENITASWTLIHKGMACMKNAEGIRPSGSNATLKSVESCKESCLFQADCIAVDWNDKAKLCNFFNKTCSEPQTKGTMWSFYQYAEHLIFWISDCSKARINGPWVPTGRRANRARYMHTKHDDLIIEYNANEKRWELLHREGYHKALPGGVLVGDVVVSNIDIKRDNGESLSKGDRGQVKGPGKGNDADSRVEVKFPKMKSLSLLPSHFSKAQNYVGHFRHPEFGGERWAISINMRTQVEGSWTARGQTITIRVSQAGETITFEDNRTKLVGEFSGRAIIGEVIQDGLRGGEFQLTVKEAFDVLGDKVLYVSYSESFGVPLRNWAIPEERRGNVLKINFPGSLDTSNAGTRYLNGKWAITSTHGLQPRYELLEHGNALMEWNESQGRWLIFQTKANAVNNQSFYRSMPDSDSRFPPRSGWQVAARGQLPAPVVDQVEDDVLTRLQEEGAFDVSRPVAVLWSGFNDTRNIDPPMKKKALDDFVKENGFVSLHNHGYSSRSAIGQLLEVEGVDRLSACGSDLTKPLWRTWSEIWIVSMLKIGVGELIIAVGNKTADNINETILYRNELALLGENWGGITYSMRVVLLLMQGRCYELGQKIKDRARIPKGQDYVCRECNNKSLDACYEAAMDVNVSARRRITH